MQILISLNFFNHLCKIFLWTVLWPATTRSSKIWPAISRSVCRVAGPEKVGLFKNGPQTAGQLAVQVRPAKVGRPQHYFIQDSPKYPCVKFYGDRSIATNFFSNLKKSTEIF